MENQWKSNQNVIAHHKHTQTKYQIEITTIQDD